MSVIGEDVACGRIIELVGPLRRATVHRRSHDTLQFMLDPDELGRRCLLIAEYAQAGTAASPTDLIAMAFATGSFTNETRGTSATVLVPQGPAHDILVRGGLIPYLQRKLHGS